MKARTVTGAAAALVALGAAGDHFLLSGGHTQAAPARATSTAKTSSPVTTSFANNAGSNASVSAASIDAATTRAYAVASPSVVYVENVGIGSGSGVIYDTKGDIVTNNHVISGGSHYKVTLNNGKTYTASLVGTDPVDDLAVIRIDASGLTPAQFAAKGSYQMAQTVLAIGSPLGLKQSVTSGLISGLNRVEQEPNGAYLPDAIQTSAPINPGNSGGALVTLDGTVVGIPTLEQTSSSSGESAQNIGFAVASDRVTLVAGQIISTGKVEHTDRAYLGIAPTDAQNALGNGFGGGWGFGNGGQTPNVAGALVQQLSPTGPAAKAGVQQGDVITKVDGQTITSADDLLTILAQKKPGDSISLTINRNGSTQTVHVTLGELPA